MQDKTTLAERVVFAVEITPSRIAITLQGEWDADLLDAVTEFVTRQRRRLPAQTEDQHEQI